MSCLKTMRWGVIVAALLGSFALADAPTTQRSPATRPASAEPKTQFVRYIEDGKGGAMLETTAVTYHNKAQGVSVTLVGAIHIADASYFKGLDESFDHYDAVLYEMVKPRDAQPTDSEIKTKRRGGGLAFIGGMQRFMRDNLALEFQLERIKYDGRENFIHADLDSETFLKMQEERNEGFVRVFLRAMLRESARMGSGEGPAVELTLPQLLAAMKSPDRPRQLKLLLAKQLQSLDKQMELFEGENGSVIVTERNKKCLDVLEQAVGDGHRNIAIFYGAGHFPDMEQRLIAMGYAYVGQTWRTAWDMRAPTTRPSK